MVALVVLGALAAAGCGIPSDGHPRTLSASGVPFNLLAPTTTSVPEQSTDQPDLKTADIYVLGQSGRLVPVGRKLAPPVTLSSVLGQLFEGPSVGELAAGFQSFISTQARLLDAEIVVGVANIDVSKEFTEVSGNEQILALAQIVYTATAVPGVQSVSFSLAGDPKEVPTQDGTLTTKPLTRTDYARLAER